VTGIRFFDAQALAKAKGCKYAVRHLSVSPEREMSPANLSEFLRSVDVEFNIGAERPRLVVRHVKKGRAHFPHCDCRGRSDIAARTGLPKRLQQIGGPRSPL